MFLPRRPVLPLIRAAAGLALAIGALAAAASCSAPSGAADEKGASVAAAARPSQSADVRAGDEADELLRVADAIEKRVEELRGLSFKRPVPRVIRTAEEIRKDFLEARFDELFPREKRLGDEKALAVFGLLPPETDLKELLLDLLAEQVGGYFDPWRRELTVRANYPLDVLKLILAHEITHALDDQHFDLEKLIRECQMDDDLAFAHGSVTEGSAMDVMMRYGASEPSLFLGAMADPAVQQTDVLQKAPPYLALSLVLPYVKGLAFLQHQKARGTSVDDVFRNLPRSSEQILHPEKYGVDLPVEVAPPDVGARLGPYWREVARGRLGEVGVSAVFLPLFSPGPLDVMAIASGTGTDYVATGWGGDAFVAYENSANRRVLVAWRTAWDSDEDASEFTLAFHDLVYRRDPGARLERVEPFVFRTASGEVILSRRGLVVDVVIGAFPDQVDSLIGE